MMLLCFVLPAMAMEDENSLFSLSTNTIFKPMNGEGESTSIKANIGVSLKKVGFLLDSQTQKQYKIFERNTVLYTKIYKKGDYTVEYSYYNDSENEPFFISLKIIFPTISSCETFYNDIVKRIKDDERYWDSIPGGFYRGDWEYGKDKSERIGFGTGESNAYWHRNGKIFTYNYEVKKTDW